MLYVISIPKTKAVCRKILKGHINKVTCVNFSGDSRHALSGSLDGKLIVWDCYTGNKTMVSFFSPSCNILGSCSNSVEIMLRYLIPLGYF